MHGGVIRGSAGTPSRLWQRDAMRLARALVGSESRATVENPRVSLQDPEAWQTLYEGGDTSATGIKVNPEKSLCIAAVWQAVSMISGDVARLPLDVYRRSEADDGREVDKMHPAWWLVRRQPNDWQSAVRFWRWTMVVALLWNNAFVRIRRNGREEPGELTLLDPNVTELEEVNGRPWIQTELQREDGRYERKTLDYADVLHIAGPSVNGMAGARLVKYARDAFGLSLARQGFASKFFKHGVRSGGILEVPIGANPTFTKNVQDGFLRHHEGEDGWFKTVVLRDGVKFHQTSFNAQEAQMNETSEEVVREVARYFNMQPSRLGVKESVSYNSKAEDNQDYLDTTLSPWLADIASECDSKMLSLAQQRADSHYFEHNTRALLRMDYLKRVQAGSMGTKARLFTVNEWRHGENLPDIDGGDDLPPLPDPTKFAGGADKGENDKPRGPADDAPADGRSADLPARRMAFLLANVAREKAADHRAFGKWLSGDQKWHRERAAATGVAESLVDEFVTAIRTAEDVPVSELAAAVDRIATEFEGRF
jgi:HK97 family phage portal protein